MLLAAEDIFEAVFVHLLSDLDLIRPVLLILAEHVSSILLPTWKYDDSQEFCEVLVLTIRIPLFLLLHILKYQIFNLVELCSILLLDCAIGVFDVQVGEERGESCLGHVWLSLVGRLVVRHLVVLRWLVEVLVLGLLVDEGLVRREEGWTTRLWLRV